MANKNKKRRNRQTWLSRVWRRYEYKHTTLAISSIIAFVLLLNTALVQGALSYTQELGIAGIIIAGVLFTSFFTTAPAIVLLLALSNSHSPLFLAVYGAIGSVIGDWIILKLFEERVAYELRPLARKLHLMSFIRLLSRKKERDKTTLVGMLAIASPLPDEIGLGLLGIAHLPTVSLLVITYLLNAAGILILVLLV